MPQGATAVVREAGGVDAGRVRRRAVKRTEGIIERSVLGGGGTTRSGRRITGTVNGSIGVLLKCVRVAFLKGDRRTVEVKIVHSGGHGVIGQLTAGEVVG